MHNCVTLLPLNYEFFSFKETRIYFGFTPKLFRIRQKLSCLKRKGLLRQVLSGRFRKNNYRRKSGGWDIEILFCSASFNFAISLLTSCNIPNEISNSFSIDSQKNRRLHVSMKSAFPENIFFHSYFSNTIFLMLI